MYNCNYNVKNAVMETARERMFDNCENIGSCTNEVSAINIRWSSIISRFSSEQSVGH